MVSQPDTLRRDIKRGAKLAAKVTGLPYQTCQQLLAGETVLGDVGDTDVQLELLAVLMTLPGPAREFAYDLARQLDTDVLDPWRACDPDELEGFLHDYLFSRPAAA